MKYFLVAIAISICYIHGHCQIELKYPLIEKYGGIVPIETAIKPTEGGKILIDLTTEKRVMGDLNSGLERIARLINLYAYCNIDPSDLDIAIIIHGGATPVISQATSSQNKELLQSLDSLGVDFMVCGQSMARRGIEVKNINPEIKVAISAITTLIEYQNQGFKVLMF